MLRITAPILAASMLMLSCAQTTHQTSPADLTTSVSSEEMARQPKSQIKLENVGFYLDPKTKSYFTNRGSTFSLKSSEDDLGHIEVAIDNDRFRAYKGPLTFDRDGAHVVRYRSVGPFDEKGPVGTMKVFVDNAPPVMTTTWSGPQHVEDGKLYINTATKFGIQAEDALSGTAKIFVKLNPKMQPKEYSTPFSFKSEGLKSVWIASADNVGNLSSWQRVPFQVDATAPRVHATVHGTHKQMDSFIFIGQEASVTLKAASRGAALDFIEYRIDDGPALKYTDSIRIQPTDTSISFRAVDKVGNMGSWKSMRFKVDDAKPEISVTKLSSSISENGIIYAKPGFSIRVMASDQGAGLQETHMSDDQQNFTEIKQRKITFKDPGVHHVAFRAKDAVGNTRETEVISIYIDNQVEDSQLKPKQKLVPHGNTFITSLPNSLTIVGNDAGVGVNHIEYSYDGKVFHKLTGPLDLAMWTKNKRTLFYRSVDKLGNMEETKSISITLQKQSKGVKVFVGTQSKVKPLTDIQKKIEAAKTPASEPSQISKAASSETTTQ